MNDKYTNPQNPNCECQCHFPPSVICPITHCCHCISNNIPYSVNGFSPYSSTSSFYPSDKDKNMNFMNSYSTNFRSNNDSLNLNRDYYLKKTRNNQNQLGRNFSEPNIHILKNQNNNYSELEEKQNIIQHEPYINDNNKNYLSYNLDINNSNLLNKSINKTQIQPNYNNTISYGKPNYNEKNDNINLTYDYYENKNQNDLKQNKIINEQCSEKLCDNKNLYEISPKSQNFHPPTSNHEKIHDMLTILQKENEFLKTQRDDALNKLSALENIKNIDRVKFDELENENNELRKLLNDAIKKNNEKDGIILDLKNDLNELQNAMHDKDREINDLIVNMKRLEQDANNEIDKLKNKIDDLEREKEAMNRKFQKEINDLNNEIKYLNNKLADEERKVKELQNKIKNMKRFDNKKQELLENLFNWYNNINRLLNTNTANGKAPPKELLGDIVNLKTNEEFKSKLDQIEDKLRQFIDNYKLKFGECFACDIACCTSEVDRLRYFRKYYPGPPKNYLEGKKKCKCP